MKQLMPTMACGILPVIRTVPVLSLASLPHVTAVGDVSSNVIFLKKLFFKAYLSSARYSFEIIMVPCCSCRRQQQSCCHGGHTLPSISQRSVLWNTAPPRPLLESSGPQDRSRVTFQDMRTTIPCKIVLALEDAHFQSGVHGRWVEVRPGPTGGVKDDEAVIEPSHSFLGCLKNR